LRPSKDFKCQLTLYSRRRNYPCALELLGKGRKPRVETVQSHEEAKKSQEKVENFMNGTL